MSSYQCSYLYNQFPFCLYWFPIWIHTAFVLTTPASYVPPTPTEDFDRICAGHHTLFPVSLLPSPRCVSLDQPCSHTVTLIPTATLVPYQALPPARCYRKQTNRKDIFALCLFFLFWWATLCLHTNLRLLDVLLEFLLSELLLLHPLTLTFYLHWNEAQPHGQVRQSLRICP